MASLTITNQIHAPINKVFELFTDIENWHERIDGIVRVKLLTDLPVEKGTRFQETRIMFKREATEEMEFVEFDPPIGYTLQSHSCGSEFTMAHRFVDKGDDTEITFEMQTKAMTIFAKLMTPLSFLMMGTMKKCIVADFGQMKEYLESQESQSVEHAG